jgi:hypothetical protein
VKRLKGQIFTPASFRREVTLKDGSKIVIRPIQCEDKDLVYDLLHRVSKQTLLLRYHHVKPRITEEEVKDVCNIDYRSMFILAGEKKHNNALEIVALAQYSVLLTDDSSAEVSFMVDDKEQGKGIATYMLKDLAAIAKQQGIKTFIGELTLANSVMLAVLKKFQPDLEQKMEDTTITVTVRL